MSVVKIYFALFELISFEAIEKVVNLHYGGEYNSSLSHANPDMKEICFCLERRAELL
jgi:hypothetical protein